MNPDVTFVPFFGIRQKIYFPTLIDLKRAPARILNLYFLKFKTVYDLSHYVNKKLESFRRKSEIDKVRNALEEICLSLYCDYTPLGYYNLDLAIRNWFSVEGNNLDFDFLIFFEYDMYATKPIAHLYAKYTTYDAGFVGYGKVDSSWYWYNRPPGARKSIISWLVKRGLKPYLYCGVFAGHMVSREVLTCLEKTPLPYGFCEMRWPSIIAGLGFKCTNLNFPMVRYGRPIHKSEIIANERLGLFHPVYEDIDLSTK
ncbi:MAG: hypothetical protein RMJ07_06840 [Nitrososphaerota archaeon]|nr:hypothetical protein [Candidatus Bathyarchaeota archaeon]MDW8049370.1 hypothetical protein [Nitrososphaerota archaeon]